MIACGIVLWLTCVAIYDIKGQDFLDKVFPYTLVLPAYLCFLVVSKHKGFKYIFTFITVCNLGLLRTYLGMLSYSNNLVVRTLLETFVAIITIILLLKIYRKPYFLLLDTLDKGWALLCCVPILLNTLNYLLLYLKIPHEYTYKTTPIVLLGFVLMFVFYAVVFVNFKNISHFFKLKETEEIMQMQIEMQKKEYEKINDIQIYRHDIRHHINVINAFLDDNNIAETQKYLETLSDNLNKTIIETYCKNYIINVILSTYIQKAKDAQIEVECKISIPENISIDNIELGLIFTNAIENAINACKKIDSPKDRKITILCKEHFSQLYIQISNTFWGNIVWRGAIPVSAEKGHGFGTRSIVSIVEKYKGTYQFSKVNDTFKVSIILKYK